MKQKVKVVFVVLTYINSSDLKEFISSLTSFQSEYHVIVVNSYFDEQSKTDIELIAKNNNCTFLNVPNHGYSAGNNRGIELANRLFDYEYLIVSNADILVRELPISKLDTLTKGIYAPKIINSRGTLQNPMLILENKLSDWLIYQGFKTANKFCIYSGIALNKIIRELWLFVTRGRKTKRIFQPHGAFIIFSRQAIKQLSEVFDEHLFLFGEEGILAKKAKRLSIPIFYTPDLICYHKEDGSVNLFSGNLQEEYRKSTIYYYEKYCQKGEKLE